MAWIKFNRDFPWKPTSQSTIFYKGGSTYNVKGEVAEKAISRGAAVKMEKRSKTAKPTEAKEEANAD